MATLRCYLTTLYKTSEWKDKSVCEGVDWDCRHEHAQSLVPLPIQSLPRQLATTYVCSHDSNFTTSGVPREGGRVGVQHPHPPSEIPKVFQNRAKLNPTVKNC